MMRTRITSGGSGSRSAGVTLVAGGILLGLFLAFCLLREKEITKTLSESYGNHLRASSRSMTVLALGGGGDEGDNKEKKQPTTSTRKYGFENSEYISSPMESYIMNHMEELNLTKKSPELVPTCHLWTEPTTTPYHTDMIHFLDDLERYYKKIKEFTTLADENITDLRLSLHQDMDDSDKEKICQKVDLVDVVTSSTGGGGSGGGLPALFPNEKLSYTTSSGYVEPLLPPMRHPKWCINQTGNIMASIEYLVHDFGHLCRRKLQRTSRIVLFDLGATLYFGAKRWPSPVLRLTKLFQKFGFPFDHIYAWELNRKDPNVLWKQELPAYMDPSYHFINVGVEADPKSRQNPFKLLLDHYNEDDVIIFKLDIDSPAIERQLVDQLLKEPRLLELIDHFYFEHHVNQKELRPFWGLMEESVEESFTIFHELRKKGLAAHFWN